MFNIARKNFAASPDGFQKSNTHFPPGNRRLSQKSLFEAAAPSPAALYKKASDASHHGRKSRYFFQLFCSFNHKQFGGLYSLAEATEIIEAFKGYRDQISARAFGLVAERVVAQSAGRAL